MYSHINLSTPHSAKYLLSLASWIMLTCSPLMSDTMEMSFRQIYSFMIYQLRVLVGYYSPSHRPKTGFNHPCFLKYVQIFSERCLISHNNGPHVFLTFSARYSQAPSQLIADLRLLEPHLWLPFNTSFRDRTDELQRFVEINTFSLSSPSPDCWSTGSTAATWRTPRRHWMN